MPSIERFIGLCASFGVLAVLSLPTGCDRADFSPVLDVPMSPSPLLEFLFRLRLRRGFRPVTRSRRPLRD
jgi:hypothetical protein